MNWFIRVKRNLVIVLCKKVAHKGRAIIFPVDNNKLSRHKRLLEHLKRGGKIQL